MSVFVCDVCVVCNVWFVCDVVGKMVQSIFTRPWSAVTGKKVHKLRSGLGSVPRNRNFWISFKVDVLHGGNLKMEKKRVPTLKIP